MSQDNLVKLECTECRGVNYQTFRNKKKVKEKLQINKHCAHCKTHRLHKETK